jgi:hypothetical protein
MNQTNREVNYFGSEIRRFKVLTKLAIRNRNEIDLRRHGEEMYDLIAGEVQRIANYYMQVEIVKRLNSDEKIKRVLSKFQQKLYQDAKEFGLLLAENIGNIERIVEDIKKDHDQIKSGGGE